MSLIKILPENLVNQIAAGEVVERPASVVKELVENSLDAGASEVVIEAKDAGKTLLKISDDGRGMSREDCELALQRHATSKISSEADLWQIATMGFRGEALASISSVSKMVLRSRDQEAVSGTEIICEGGEIRSIGETGMKPGTQIEVWNLFFNTPARQKYLKKDSTELSQINHVVDTIALSHPGIAFKFIHNGKVVSDYRRSQDLMTRVAEVFGRATAEAMVPVFFGGGEFQIDGFVGKPAISRSSSQHQYFFVNGRAIQHYILANTVKEAFKSMLMENKKPVFVINIKIDPSLIDVNVHPRKLEIRFENQREVIAKMYSAVKATLEKTDLAPKGFTESRRYMSDSFPQRESFALSSGSANFPAPRPRSFDTQGAMDFSREILSEREHKSPEFKEIFQVANSYIIAKEDEGFTVIDQHAAHERVRFEELMDQFENEEKSIQSLLVPQQIELSNEEAEILRENMEIFVGLGFEIEELSGRIFMVNAVPAFLSKEELDDVIKGVLDDIKDEKNPSKFQGKSIEIINYMSCRSAIKFGQKLSVSEMQALISQMEKLKRPYTCPHGRPTMISMNMDELGKMFGRK